jgi:putative FmdB family regulatory protein
MPIYEYRPKGKKLCGFCRPGFDRLEKVHAKPLGSCPECGAPVQRIISAPKLARLAPSLDGANLEKHGFTQYRKTSKGVYQKTAGKGPDVISDD